MRREESGRGRLRVRATPADPGCHGAKKGKHCKTAGPDQRLNMSGDKRLHQERIAEQREKRCEVREGKQIIRIGVAPNPGVPCLYQRRLPWWRRVATSSLGLVARATHARVAASRWSAIPVGMRGLRHVSMSVPAATSSDATVQVVPRLTRLEIASPAATGRAAKRRPLVSTIHPRYRIHDQERREVRNVAVGLAAPTLSVLGEQAGEHREPVVGVARPFEHERDEIHAEQRRRLPSRVVDRPDLLVPDRDPVLVDAVLGSPQPRRAADDHRPRCRGRRGSGTASRRCRGRDARSRLDDLRSRSAVGRSSWRRASRRAGARRRCRTRPGDSVTTAARRGATA